MKRFLLLLLTLSVFAQDYKPFRYPKLPVQDTSCTVVTSGDSALAAKLRALHVVPPAAFPTIHWAAGDVAAVIALKSSDGALVTQPPAYASGRAVFSYLPTAGAASPGSEVDVIEIDKAKFAGTPSCSLQRQQAIPFTSAGQIQRLGASSGMTIEGSVSRSVQK